MRQTTEQLTYSVPGMSCDHCRAAVTAEVEQVTGVSTVDVDLAMFVTPVAFALDIVPPSMRPATRSARTDVRSPTFDAVRTP